MEIKRIAFYFFCVLATIYFSFFLFSNSDEIWQSVLFFIAFIFGTTFLLLNRDYTFLIGSTVFFSHIFYSGGMKPVHGLIGLVLCAALPLSFVTSKLVNTKRFIASMISIGVCISAVFIFRPYVIRPEWVVVFGESLLFFLICQFIPWNIIKIEKVVFWHLSLSVVYGLCEIIFDPKARIGGPVPGGATVYGVLLVTEWAIWFSSAIANRRSLWKIVLFSLISIFVILKTGTRMALVAIEITVVLNIAFHILRDTRLGMVSRAIRFSAALGALLILSAVAWNALPESMAIKRHVSSMVKGNMDLSSTGRIAAWYAAIDIFQKHPLFGVGNGNFSDHMVEFYQQMGFDPKKFGILAFHAHNLYLAILSENGILGFQILIVLILLSAYGMIAWFRDKNKQKEIFGLFCGLVILLALGLVDAIPFHVNALFWGAWFFASLLQLPHPFSNPAGQKQSPIVSAGTSRH